MTEYIIKRIAQGVLLLFVVSVLIFSLMYIMPGDPVSIIAGDRVSQEKRDEISEKWGLNDPLYVQYGTWLGRVLQGDMGTSIKTKISVNETLAQKIPVTLTLCGLALFFEFIIAVPLGLIAAYKRGSLLDKSLMVVTTILGAIPKFWLAILLILAFSVTNHIFPMSGFDDWRYMVLPTAAIVIPAINGTLRLTRSEVLEVYREKYILTGYAKGLKNKAILVKHVLRNALIPVCVMFFLYLPWLFGGELIIENIFSIPGMGRLMWQGIVTQDFPVVQACILTIALLTVICNTLGDIMTGFLDPRIRIELKGDIK